MIIVCWCGKLLGLIAVFPTVIFFLFRYVFGITLYLLCGFCNDDFQPGRADAAFQIWASQGVAKVADLYYENWNLFQLDAFI